MTDIPFTDSRIKLMRWALKVACDVVGRQIGDDIPAEDGIEILAKLDVLDDYLVDKWLEQREEYLDNENHEQLKLFTTP